MPSRSDADGIEAVRDVPRNPGGAVIADIAGILPPNATRFGALMEVGCPAARTARGLRDRAAVRDVMDRFGQAFPGADPRALVSYWSFGYFAALIIPTVTAALCLDRLLPVRLDEIGLEIDQAGQISRLVVADAGTSHRPHDGRPRLAILVDGHLRPVIGLLAAQGDLSERVLWGNAATILAFILSELLATTAVIEEGRREAEARLGLGEHRGCALSQPLRAFREGGDRRRRVCCLRYRIPGIAPCGVVCPVAHGTSASC